MPTYNEIIESFINGQYKQAFNQFSDLGQWEKSGFTDELRSDDHLNKESKLQFLSFLFNKLLEEKE